MGLSSRFGISEISLFNAIEVDSIKSTAQASRAIHGKSRGHLLLQWRHPCHSRLVTSTRTFAGSCLPCSHI